MTCTDGDLKPAHAGSRGNQHGALQRLTQARTYSAACRVVKTKLERNRDFDQPMGTLDTSAVVDMSGMFHGRQASGLKTCFLMGGGSVQFLKVGLAASQSHLRRAVVVVYLCHGTRSAQPYSARPA